MEKIEKVYTVYDGKVVDTAVEKVTAKRIWIKQSKYFGYCRNLDKASACVTPQQAVQNEFDYALSKVKQCQDKLNEAKVRFIKAKKLLTMV